MRIFEEKQRFRQWWLILILAVIAVGSLVNLYFETEGFTTTASKSSLVLSTIFAIVIIGGIFLLELSSKIDPTGITATFHPITFFSKHYNWSQIDKIYVRKYAPLTEYGGWGIRGLGEAKAYNVAGNYGIQIVTKENKRFLIGTQRPQDAEQVLKRYTEKISH